jgi:hypothetical protein
MCCKPLAKPPVKNFEDWEGERKAKNRPIEAHDTIQSCSHSRSWANLETEPGRLGEGIELTREPFRERRLSPATTAEATSMPIATSRKRCIATIRGGSARAIPMIAEQRGKISHCKAFSRVSSCTGCKASITIAPAKNCGFLTTFKSKRWLPSADRVRKNCRHAKSRTIDGNFLRAFSKGRSNLNNSGHS